MTQKRLVKRIPFECGNLYGIVDGKRLLLAKCKPEAELYESVTEIHSIASQGYSVKKRMAGLVLCPTPVAVEFTEELFQKISCFDLSADYLREDGILENICFYNLIPNEIDLDGDWVFEIPDYSLLKRLAGI